MSGNGCCFQSTLSQASVLIHEYVSGLLNKVFEMVVASQSPGGRSATAAQRKVTVNPNSTWQGHLSLASISAVITYNSKLGGDFERARNVEQKILVTIRQIAACTKQKSNTTRFIVKIFSTKSHPRKPIIITVM